MKYEQDPVFFCTDEYGLGVELWDSEVRVLRGFYSPGIQELVLIIGMGGGKTTFLGFLACIELKTLLVQDWISKLNLLPESPLFVTIASISQNQAMDAIWNCITPRLRNSPFFQFYGPDIRTDIVKFHQKPNIFLRLVSASSATSVGRRNKFVGIDEVGKFQRTSGPRGGWQVYNSLKAGTKTFKAGGKTAVVGSPTNPNDVIMSLHRIALKNPTMFTEKMATWEFNPNSRREDFNSEFEIDPRAAMCNYGADPHAGSDLYFPNPDIFKWNNINMLEMVQEGVEFQRPPFDYVLAGDPAPVNLDKFGLALGHREGDIIHVDGAIAIGAEREINPLDVQRFILQVTDKFMVNQATFDTWTFIETLELLRSRGTTVENHVVNKEDYDNFKRLVYLNKVILPENRTLRREISSIITTGKRVKPAKQSSKDVLDAVVACVRKLNIQTTLRVPFNIVKVY